MMDRVFLDANVLFSAAYRTESPIRRLWELTGVELLTSSYVAGEAVRNLQDKHPERMGELHRLLATVRLAQPVPDDSPVDSSLPQKDRPVLAAAIEAGATHLLTGDKAHFGRYYGRSVGGVRILPPVEYLRNHE